MFKHTSHDPNGITYYRTKEGWSACSMEQAIERGWKGDPKGCVTGFQTDNTSDLEAKINPGTQVIINFHGD